MTKPRILVFGGSLRAESFNQKLATIAAEAARDAGAEVTLISLRDFRMPLFDEDLEAAEGMPEAARELKALFAEHDGLIIASPEYNSTITAALKNAIDWVSRATSPDEAAALRPEGKVRRDPLRLARRLRRRAQPRRSSGRFWKTSRSPSCRTRSRFQKRTRPSMRTEN